MKRRELLALAFAALGPTATYAQVPRSARIGFLSLHSAEKEEAGGIGISAFRAAMEARGYAEGRNMHLEAAHAAGDATKLASLAAQLITSRLDVLVAVGTEATQAARQATSTIPIVMAGVSDPLLEGFVASLARPGGNVTGTAMWSSEAAEKQLEMLKEAVPQVSDVGALHLPRSGHRARIERLRTTADRLRIRLTAVELRGEGDLERAFVEMNQNGVDGLLVLASPFLDDLRERIASLALRYRLPGAGHQPYLVQAGLLLSYAPTLADVHTRSAYLVDRIIKGTDPANLPVERAERFHLAISMKTARALGLSIPPTLLARADEVIE